MSVGVHIHSVETSPLGMYNISYSAQHFQQNRYIQRNNNSPGTLCPGWNERSSQCNLHRDLR